ncbi:MAG: hypothetical protein JHC32_07455, partial [Candidatus Aminicenantes bacterium]|nr:hypothetical protein [Candidatus Aminicenantes bacterium]
LSTGLAQKHIIQLIYSTSALLAFKHQKAKPFFIPAGCTFKAKESSELPYPIAAIKEHLIHE